jgi:hypothetical protein
MYVHIYYIAVNDMDDATIYCAAIFQRHLQCSGTVEREIEDGS